MSTPLSCSRIFSFAFSVIAIFVIAMPSPASAQDADFYVSADAGLSKNRNNRASDIVFGTTIDQKGKEYGLGFGLQLNKQFALELGYTDFGKATVSGRGTLCIPNDACLLVISTLSGELRTKATHLSLMANAPLLENLSVYGRVGVARADRSATVQSGNKSVSNNDKKTDAIYGIGLSYGFTKTIEGTVEWKALSASKADALSAGLRIRF